MCYVYVYVCVYTVTVSSLRRSGVSRCFKLSSSSQCIHTHTHASKHTITQTHLSLDASSSLIIMSIRLSLGDASRRFGDTSDEPLLEKNSETGPPCCTLEIELLLLNSVGPAVEGRQCGEDAVLINSDGPVLEGRPCGEDVALLMSDVVE